MFLPRCPVPFPSSLPPQVGTLADYPWLAEQLGVDVEGADAQAANDRFCAKTPQYCSNAVRRGKVRPERMPHLQMS